ncbi:thioredoxin family protein [Flavobacterium noncentrifugens]|uniref:Bacillithiol system protein YtxJ n=1 Tax=Flavobacterium noncentrifugens TaxID=1128970 RepID=A0A1G8WGN6_9FLAO|nr:bacillithiol system redox-active protein YtxJ [Flavobacterium noncentrifugens]GEP50894.1 thioredoxin family protein [Flavobacterium noncentrifugens]SDJ76700.1 bacillithiol system protein YtxJ [Flavobacterium noncentrifugens]
MGIFNFGNSNNKGTESSKIGWNNLTDLQQLNEIQEESNEKPVVIFKHSTRCSISRMALKQFENEFDLHGEVKPYFLNLIEHRDVSNEIANRFQVVHQSPQILLIKDGKSVYDTSHDRIDAEVLKSKIS